MNEKQNFLPLGTAVKIQNDDDIYVIISRAFMQSSEGEILAGYQAVIHPVGYGKEIPLQVVYETEILEVLTYGHLNESDEGFVEQRLEELRERIESEDDEVPIELDDEVDSDSGDVLSHEERLAEDPFYKFRK